MNFLSYIFNKAPGSEFLYLYPLLIFGVALIIGSIVESVIYKKRKKHDYAYKRLFKSLSNRLALFGMLFIALAAFRYENIPYFSMRLWLFAAILGFVYLAYKYIQKFRKDYPREKNNIEVNLKAKPSKKEENRYLPNKKKR